MLRDNSAHLRQLATGVFYAFEAPIPAQLRELLGAAGPALQQLAVQSVYFDWAQAPLHDGGLAYLLRPDGDLLPLLRAAPPFGPVCVDKVIAACSARQPPGDDAALIQLAGYVEPAGLRGLHLLGLVLAEPASLEALADLLLARTCRVESLQLHLICGLSFAFLPALLRLLAGGGALASFNLNDADALFEGASDAEVEALCAALRRSTLTHVALFNVGLTQRHVDVLREAATGNPRLRDVDIRVDYSPPGEPEEAAVALGVQGDAGLLAALAAD